MKILIVGPILQSKGYAVPFQRAGATILGRACCMDQALDVLQHYDGVVCAQSLPTHPTRAAEPPETQSGNWAAVSNRCRELGIPLVLVVSAGGYRLAERFNQVARKTLAEWLAFALVEPVSPEFVADAICTAVKHGKKQVACARDQRPGNDAWTDALDEAAHEADSIERTAGIDMVPEQAA